MKKYNYDLKLKVVQAYINGEGGYDKLAEKYDIAATSRICDWVHRYQVYGEEGLRPSSSINNYSFEFKQHVVKLYLSNKISYQELAIKAGVSSPALINGWVKAYKKGGFDALKPKRNEKMKSNKKRVSKINSNAANAKHIKELEEELLKLRIENAYLKELRRLRLEEEALLKQKRESSTASEENSN